MTAGLGWRRALLLAAHVAWQQTHRCCAIQPAVRSPWDYSCIHIAVNVTCTRYTCSGPPGEQDISQAGGQSRIAVLLRHVARKASQAPHVALEQGLVQGGLQLANYLSQHPLLLPADHADSSSLDPEVMQLGMQALVKATWLLCTVRCPMQRKCVVGACNQPQVYAVGSWSGASGTDHEAQGVLKSKKNQVQNAGT